MTPGMKYPRAHPKYTEKREIAFTVNLSRSENHSCIITIFIVIEGD